MKTGFAAVEDAVRQYLSCPGGSIPDPIIAELEVYVYYFPQQVFRQEVLNAEFYEYVQPQLREIVNKYRPVMGCSFTTWFGIVLRHKYLNFMDTKKRKRKSEVRIAYRETIDIPTTEQVSEFGGAGYAADPASLFADLCVDLDPLARLAVKCKVPSLLTADDMKQLSGHLTLGQPELQLFVGRLLAEENTYRKERWLLRQKQGALYDEIIDLEYTALNAENEEQREELLLKLKKKKRLLLKLREKSASLTVRPSNTMVAELFGIDYDKYYYLLKRCERELLNRIELRYEQEER